MTISITALESEWIESTFDDGTGYIDDSYIDYRDKKWCGVLSSLVAKGVIYNEGEGLYYFLVDKDELVDSFKNETKFRIAQKKASGSLSIGKIDLAYDEAKKVASELNSFGRAEYVVTNSVGDLVI